MRHSRRDFFKMLGAGLLICPLAGKAAATPPAPLTMGFNTIPRDTLLYNTRTDEIYLMLESIFADCNTAVLKLAERGSQS